MTKVAAYNPGGVAGSRKNVAALRKMDINAVTPRRFYTVKEKVEYCERALEVPLKVKISISVTIIRST